MKFPIRAFSAALLAFACSASMTAAHANVIIAGTRVIFPAADGEVTVRLTNQNSTPALVESWVDNGDPMSTPDKAKTPFLITPPLFRMEPNRDQSLRILFTHSDQPLPADRESVFWLNVLEVPPKPSSLVTQNANTLQMAIRSRLKLFYRPTGLAGDPVKAPGELTFKSSGAAIVVHNPTPYFVTITDMHVTVAGAPHKVDAGMVAPMSDLSLPVQGIKQAPAGSAVEYHCLNDYGSDVTLKGTIAA